MRHILRRVPTESPVEFDDAHGRVIGVAPDGSIPRGTFYRAGDAVVALYAENDALVLQIAESKFDLTSPGVKLEYWHNWHDGRTTFIASGPSARQQIVYPAWWAELHLNVQDVQFAPERDEEEDVVAYIVATWRDPDAARRLASKWSATSG
ncbi:MAG: hypothetical protein K0V04_23240 [Deltaproteobacteria bacterium]|nr:hypothetical protein [Deltaproteobacteria bacterium]